MLCSVQEMTIIPCSPGPVLSRSCVSVEIVDGVMDTANNQTAWLGGDASVAGFFLEGPGLGNTLTLKKRMGKRKIEKAKYAELVDARLDRDRGLLLCEVRASNTVLALRMLL